MTSRVRCLPALVLLAASLLVTDACRHRPAPQENEDPWAEPARPAPRATQDAGPAPVAPAPGELVPGSIRAFGIVMPAGTTQIVANDRQRMFHVQAPMSAVMRYLQRRVDITTGEIHPLGAMIQNAHVRTSGPGENFIVDVGVRDEGDRTFVTIWNRSQQPVAPRTPEEGLRAGGIDPATHRPIGGNNF